MTDRDATPAADEEIAGAAYRIWEAEGRPDGRDMDHWLRAEAQLLEAGGAGEPADDAPADHTHVRPAGRKQMDMAPGTWSKTDEEVDQSFPASDPPGNY